MRLLFCLLFSFSLFSSPVIDWKGTSYKVIRNYLKTHKQFSKEICKGSYRNYDKLYRDFRGTGYFVPVVNNKDLDRKAIEKNLFLIESKYQWISKEIEKLEKKKNIRYLQKKHDSLKDIFKRLLTLKRDFYMSDKNKKELQTSAGKSIKLLQDRFNQFLEKASFLKPYGFPINHFEQRRDYDYYKEKTDEKSQRKKNDIYFKRQVYEDGAQNPNHTRSDRFFRTLLNSVYLAFDNETGIISEDFRYDFDSLLKTMGFYLKQSKRFHLKRLKEWQERTMEVLDFYKKLLKEENSNYTSKILKEKSKAKFELKDYNLKKMSETYQFWMKQDELFRALFAIETILFNEVGDVDGRDALERYDVTQVVINRTNIPFYRSIEEDDALYPYIDHLGNSTIKKNAWLNVLFKEGEFSFTYFFISATKNIYCPDMSRRGRFLRNENLRIALQLLKKPNPDFKAIRYFSRASMLGRINMAKIWSDFKPLPLRLGKTTKKNRILHKLFKRGKYEFLHPFSREDGEQLYVLEIKNKPYVYDPGKNIFYHYRNPHYFTYFAPE